MKKIVALLLALAMMVSLTACGAAEESDAVSEAPQDSGSFGTEPSVSIQETEPTEAIVDQVDMLYYLDLGDGSIMAACYTQEGIDRMGQDYYVVHVAKANIYNAAGEEITMEELTRGCPIRVSWPGMVMESYPAQISALEVLALSDEPDPAVPPEDEIEPFGDGPRWWVAETATEVPNLVVEYANSDYVVSMMVEKRYGSWSYSQENSMSGGAANTQLDGQTPQQWTYDESNTIVRSGFDSITLSLSPEARELSVKAYVYGDEQDPGVQVELGEDGSMALLEGDFIYVISAHWDDDQYQGEATYGLLVKAE